jgi:hypothetical protein
MLGIYLGPWRSRVIFTLNEFFSRKKLFSVSAFSRKINR